MQDSTHIDNPDVILIGSGIMSATLAAMIKRLQPDLRIQLYEVTDEIAQESSDGWNNAGTGHAGICELSYTPDREADGSINVTKAIEIFQQFEQSKQFWAYALQQGMIDCPRDFINQVAHISFVYGQEQVDFLKARYAGMSAHHFFREMEFSTDREEIKRWAPLLIEGRSEMLVAATRLAAGTDVNFGTLARKLVRWVGQQPGCGVATRHRVVDLQKTSDGWDVTVKDIAGKLKFHNQASFVFIGAGGGSLPLLQKSGIDEAKGYGGFPIGGQWLVCEQTEVVARHQAKVYGQAQMEAPTMAVPHLDTRVLDGKRSLLFGPFAAWTTRFLRNSGSRLDLFSSITTENLGSLARVGLYNLPLVKYLIQQGTQSMTARMKVLRGFYPDARSEDWRLVNAGIRVQAIKKEDGAAGIVHYGTEIVTNADKSISALLGASPGASVSVSVMLDVVKSCLSHLLESKEGASEIRRMIPTWDEDLTHSFSEERFRQVNHDVDELLGLREADRVRSN
jgi:malate dehydrogenase (quinone)